MKKYFGLILICFISISNIFGMGDYEAFLALDDAAKSEFLQSKSQHFFPSDLTEREITPDNVESYCFFITQTAHFKNPAFVADTLMHFVWQLLAQVILINNYTLFTQNFIHTETTRMFSFVEIFFAYGFNINAQERKTRQTLLHRLATQENLYGQGNSVVLAFLLEHGANLALQDSNGKTPGSYVMDQISQHRRACSGLWGDDRTYMIEKIDSVVAQWREVRAW